MRKIGTGSNPPNRFHQEERCGRDTEFTVADDIYETDEFTQSSPKSTITEIQVKTVVNRNQSPDIPFKQSLNPYQGCEHGCVYCFARPSHAYIDLSPGRDFETQLFAKTNAVERLKELFNKKNYQPETLALGMNTDCYQPMERRYKITRDILKTCLDYKHPVSLVTKSSLVLRDLDILQALSKENLAHVAISMTTLDIALKSSLEPQASSPAKRLKTIETLSKNGVSTHVLLAPIIPKINDHEMEEMLKLSHEHGAQSARYVFLRLPHEVKALFSVWLEENLPLRKDAVLSLIKQSRGGKLYNSDWKSRMTGEGFFADIIAKRFANAQKKYQLDQPWDVLSCDKFARPHAQDGSSQSQMSWLDKKSQ